jgi:hypothetical protein
MCGSAFLLVGYLDRVDFLSLCLSKRRGEMPQGILGRSFRRRGILSARGASLKSLLMREKPSELKTDKATIGAEGLESNLWVFSIFLGRRGNVLVF